MTVARAPKRVVPRASCMRNTPLEEWRSREKGRETARHGCSLGVGTRRAGRQAHPVPVWATAVGMHGFPRAPDGRSPTAAEAHHYQRPRRRYLSRLRGRSISLACGERAVEYGRGHGAPGSIPRHFWLFSHGSNAVACVNHERPPPTVIPAESIPSRCRLYPHTASRSSAPCHACGLLGATTTFS